MWAARDRLCSCTAAKQGAILPLHRPASHSVVCNMTQQSRGWWRKGISTFSYKLYPLLETIVQVELKFYNVLWSCTRVSAETPSSEAPHKLLAFLKTWYLTGFDPMSDDSLAWNARGSLVRVGEHSPLLLLYRLIPGTRRQLY